MTKLCVATRIHGLAVCPELKSKIISFIERALVYSKLVLIAVKVDLTAIGSDQDLYNFISNTVSEYPSTSTVLVLPITEWGRGVTPALNALLQRALTMHATHILYQSLEVRVSAEDVSNLSFLCGDDTLVVGARFQGHIFEEGESVPATGRSVPWNTLGLWNASTLAVTGFPMVADGVIEGTAWGVEEVSAIGLAQLVSPAKSKAKLVVLPSVEWQTAFTDPERLAAHERKMESKLTRPATHMRHFPTDAQGIVEHVKESGSMSDDMKLSGESGSMSDDMKLSGESLFSVHLATIDVHGTPLQIDELQSPLKSRATSAAAAQTDAERLFTSRDVVDGLMTMDECSHAAAVAPRTVLVTGGAGFIGSHTSARLLVKGDRVVVVDEVNDYYSVKQKEDNIEWLQGLSEMRGHGELVIVRGDICDDNLMLHVFQGYDITHVVHLAARAGVRPSIEDPMIYVHSNVRGTTKLLELARQHQCQHFVYASSSSVYGDTSREVFRESDRTDTPVSPYAATKKACELMAATYSHLYDMHTAGLRFFTVYGPRGRPDMAPYLFIDNICHGRPIKQFGDGSSERDYTYIDDIVSGVLGALDNPKGCQVYNLGNGRPIALRDFIAIAGDCVGKRPIITEFPPQAGDVTRTCADISLAKDLIGYSPQVPFEIGMQKTAEWFRFRDCTCPSPSGTPPLKFERGQHRSLTLSERCRHRDTTSVTGNRSKGKS